MREVNFSYRCSRVVGDSKEGSIAGSGRDIEFLAAREKRRVGDNEPSMCKWCSHFGRSWRNWWWAVLHILNVVESKLLGLRLDFEVSELMILSPKLDAGKTGCLTFVLTQLPRLCLSNSDSL